MYKDDGEVLKKNLEEAREKGVSLFLEGRPATPEKIVDKCLKEDTVYMPDYVVDDLGEWKEIRYDCVKSGIEKQ